MRNIDISKLTKQELVDFEALCKALKKYLVNEGGYFESEADDMLRSDFESPYTARFIMQEFIGQRTIDGKRYEVRHCHTEFRVVGIWDFENLPPFEFYMFIDLETLKGKTVGDYEDAFKLYLV